MVNISVRKIDDEIVAKLRVQAAQDGVSMEEEVRQILERGVSSQNQLGNMALQYFGDGYGVELELPVHMGKLQ